MCRVCSIHDPMAISLTYAAALWLFQAGPQWQPFLLLQTSCASCERVAHPPSSTTHAKVGSQQQGSPPFTADHRDISIVEQPDSANVVREVQTRQRACAPQLYLGHKPHTMISNSSELSPCTLKHPYSCVLIQTSSELCCSYDIVSIQR